MNEIILVEINGVVNFSVGKTIVVKETDELLIAIQINGDASMAVIQFEDYEIEATRVERLDGIYLQIPAKTYFSECFGNSIVRVSCGEVTVSLFFDVLAKKTSAEQAIKMVKYLANISTSLIKSCLARTALPVGAEVSEQIEPEALLTSAETIISTLQSSRHELMSNYRERLVPTRLPRSKSKVTCEIDPMELLGNLDALSPAMGIGEVVLRGRNFDLGDIEVSSLQPTADVFENHVLLGGLYSIYRKIHAMQQMLAAFPTTKEGTPAGYESFSRLLLSLTAGGMIRRCSLILVEVEGFIDLLENKLGVTYSGEITPVMTPFVRSTRVYRSLYGQLSDWYSMGNPIFGGIQFLMKMKSLSKIYEIFTFYHLLEEMLRQGWTLATAIQHPEFGEYVPSSVSFTLKSERLVVDYEPRINRISDQTKDQDLIDVAHSATAEYPYWTPDFVLRWDVGRTVRYIILDAKYSNANSVREYAIPALYTKYYEGIGVFDASRQIVINSPITAVLAIYALDFRAGGYISKWSNQGVFSRIPRLPAIGGVGLMLDNDEGFNKCIARVFELSRLTIHGETTTIAV